MSILIPRVCTLLRTTATRTATPIGLSTSTIRQRIQLPSPTLWVSKPPNIQKMTLEQPKVIVTPDNVSSESEDARYTLCLTDPDAASRDNPKWAEFCHWLVTGIQLPSSGPLDFKNSKELLEYMGPAPPENTGKHRYVLLLFKNGKKEPHKLDGRKKWGFEDHEPRVGARHYAKKYDLELVGANFFLCQNEKQDD
ncbi:hypothetical protein TWF788_010720 [Orbilia oligospora]|uniref:Uncharacterized protein n=1 Tax=Orbilia oligospora TaxID=2813651 RepID=A0A7C8KR47_ORBOL|nr:hypothetical protein TWF788_010720 [Orbilia oligospora]